jgi:hypothetical protein
MTSTIKVNTIQNTCGADIIKESSNTITIGASGDTVTLASGASQTGFGRTGSVDWQTGSVKTSTFTAASGEGYFVNSGSALTMNLPAGSAGAIVAVSDYARNFATYNLTVSPNGSEKIGGVAQDATLDIDGQAATFVYVDSTKGWVNVQNAEDTETGIEPYIGATGGTITTCGNFKIHTFTGPGTFTVCRVATESPAPGFNTVSYMVVAGGGGGSGSNSAGGGAGGFREFKGPGCSYTASPLNGNPGGTSVVVTAQAYPITVGAGGSTRGNPFPVADSGSNSIFSTVTSAGGGGGGASDNPPARNGAPGGSGGGGGSFSTGNPGTGGSGNTPPVSPPQGNNGGNGAGQCGVARSGGGGGGATAAGGNATFPTGGPGGAGAGTAIAPASGTPGPDGALKYFAGGGGSGCSPSPGGVGGGGPKTTAGTTNTGGGGGAGGGSGGSGIVVIRYRFQ